MLAHPLLVPCCWTLIVVLSLIILVPYLRGRSDLLTAWNIFLLGAMNFVGGAGLMAGYYPDFFRILDYTKRDYENYMLGIIVFFATLIFTYYVIKLPRRVAGKVLRKWPPATDNVLCFMLVVSVGLGLMSIFPPRLVGITQIIIQLGSKAIVVAMVLAFVAWYRNLINPVMFLIFVVTAMFAMVFAIASGSGRRTMVGIMIALPVCLYWLRYRYHSPKKNVIYVSVFGVIALFVIGAYSHVRHFDRQRGKIQERSVSNSWEVLMTIPSLMGHFDTKQLIGQNAAQTSLAAIHVYTYDLDPSPFHTVLFVLSYPLPRAIWPDKPVGLGFTLPRVTKARGRATWGPGIVGHGFHEGGLHMLVFYGFLAAVALRFFDELLTQQPDNPYLLGTMSAMAGHIFGWTRGDVGTFSNQIVTGFLLCLLYCYAGRIFFGTGVTYPSPDNGRLTTTSSLPVWNQQLPERS